MPERRELQKGGRRPEVPEAPTGVEAHLRGEPVDLLLEAELPGEVEVVDVGSEEVVVEALERRPAHLERPDEAPRFGPLFEDGDAESFPEKAVGRHEAREAPSDDGNAGARHRGSLTGVVCYLDLPL